MDRIDSKPLQTYTNPASHSTHTFEFSVACWNLTSVWIRYKILNASITPKSKVWHDKWINITSKLERGKSALKDRRNIHVWREPRLVNSPPRTPCTAAAALHCTATAATSSLVRGRRADFHSSKSDPRRVLTSAMAAAVQYGETPIGPRL